MPESARGAPDARLHSAAAERNRGPILAALQLVLQLPPVGRALEIASGTGQHAAHFAAALPHWDWQPSDADPALRGSIDAWCTGRPNVRPALALDVTVDDWTGAPTDVDLVFCANLVHIAPWPVTPALMRGAARHAGGPEARLVLYGPFRVDGEPLADGNVAFDADLRRRDAAWGLRRLAEVQAAALDAGWHLQRRVAMPANNLLLAFGRRPVPDAPDAPDAAQPAAPAA